MLRQRTLSEMYRIQNEKVKLKENLSPSIFQGRNLRKKRIEQIEDWQKIFSE